MAAKKPTPKKKKKEKPKVTLEDLQAVAKEFNRFMFDKGDGIDIDLEYNDLLKETLEAADDLVKEDEITPATAATLVALGVKHSASIAPAEDTEDTKEEEEVEEEEGSKEEGEETEDEKESEPVDVTDAITAVKKAKKDDAIKAIAKENGIRIPPPFLKDIKKLREYVTGKLNDLASGVSALAKKKGEKKTSGKVEKAGGIVKYTRSNALIDALKASGKKGRSRSEIVIDADQRFVDAGGLSNHRVSDAMFGYVTPSLIILKVIAKNENNFSWN